MYDLPEFNAPKLKGLFRPNSKAKQDIRYFSAVIIISAFFGLIAGGVISGIFYFQIKEYLKRANPSYFTSQNNEELQSTGYIPQTFQEQAVIDVVKKVSPAVVSIIISKDIPVYEQYYENPFKDYERFFGPLPEFLIPKYRQKGVQKKEIGGGTGFIISSDGLILTNKHVVLEKDAEYTILTNDGKRFSAKVLARDPVQDLAVLKIEKEKTINKDGSIISKRFPTIKLGDSDSVQIGQTVIAIGNALGEFRNTVSVGVVSGLGRSITASGGDFVETLEDIIQTDAAINKGNSGGPLLNLKGEVIGVNTAVALDAQNIGFAIPINKAKRDINQVIKSGKIIYPFLGIRYVLVDDKIKEEKKLKVDYGALIIGGKDGEPAVLPDSAAEKAGLKEGDIILEFNNEKITQDNSLGKIISKYNAGDKVKLKVLRGDKEINLEVVLGERSE